MNKAEEIIVEHIRLAKEFAELPLNGGNTLEEAEIISKRKTKINNRIQKLRHQLLFEQYLESQSKEWKEEIIGFKPFKQPGRDICIKVTFTWGWLRVYRTTSNGIEWY